MNFKTRISFSYSLSMLLFMSAFNLGACAQLKRGTETDDASKAKSISQVPASSEPEPVIPSEPVGIKKGDILLAYPRGENNNKIDAPATFLIGSVTAGKKLLLDGQEVKTNAQGYFAQVVKLAFGKNDFNLHVDGQGASDGLKVTVERPAPPPVLSTNSFNILPESLSPKEDIGVTAGDIIQIAARATPGCIVTAKFGGHTVALKPAVQKRKDGKTTVNLGLATTFGVTFQRSPSALKDLYLGFYKVAPNDNFQNANVIFTLQKSAAKGAQSIQAKAEGKVSVVQQPILLSTAHKDTIVRLGPGQARTTPLPEGVRLMADGYLGQWWRLDLAPGRHVWIAKEDMVADEEINNVPLSKVSTVNLETDSYGARVVVPLNQKLPYQIEQDLSGGKLSLHIFGITSDTDFVTSDQKPSDSACAKLIDYVTWRQKSDRHYELVTQLKSKDQWGFYADYEENSLVLHIKTPPPIDVESGTLKGLTICVDPGHGGKEPGAIACSGVKEATLNYALGKQFQNALEALGAKVIMTRTAEQYAGLQERVDTAIASKADMLISVHNNSLPDGRDPWKEHGSSSYWYHTQSMGLANLARERLVKDGGLKDFGTRYQNLALCRPSNMLACLVEVGFVINPDELSALQDPKFQETVGKSLAESVKTFLYQKLGGLQNNQPSPAANQ
ncbi:MAG: N-acetylmuramoyl-L-alanine amidase [Candidatus Obscuribacterales bacterium]|jgi:N-acetylmuramoyl-L-alanine amidase|nr:N-acetylmuramoyl-L-alanine amidase [Candidatus Obscuribacterales bacterium]